MESKIHRSIAQSNNKESPQFRITGPLRGESNLHAFSQIAQTLGSTLIRYRSDSFASDRYLIDIDMRAFAI